MYQNYSYLYTISIKHTHIMTTAQFKKNIMKVSKNLSANHLAIYIACQIRVWNILSKTKIESCSDIEKHLNIKLKTETIANINKVSYLMNTSNKFEEAAAELFVEITMYLKDEKAN